MKYFIALFLAAGVCFAWLRTHPAASAVKPAPNEPHVVIQGSSVIGAPQHASSNVLKRPLDRTREVLGQVQKNNAENAF